jgi:replicative DNA helicase Mcm
MAQTGNQELTERFIQFYRNYYREEVGRLAQEYPNERRSLYVDYNDLFTFDRDLAEDYLAKPEQMQEYAEEALRLYDLPADVSLGQAHVRLRGLPSEQTVDIRDLRVQDDHIGSMIAVQGIVRNAAEGDRGRLRVPALRDDELHPPERRRLSGAPRVSGL